MYKGIQMDVLTARQREKLLGRLNVKISKVKKQEGKINKPPSWRLKLRQIGERILNN